MGQSREEGEGGGVVQQYNTVDVRTTAVEYDTISPLRVMTAMNITINTTVCTV